MDGQERPTFEHEEHNDGIYASGLKLSRDVDSIGIDWYGSNREVDYSSVSLSPAHECHDEGYRFN